MHALKTSSNELDLNCRYPGGLTLLQHHPGGSVDGGGGGPFVPFAGAAGTVRKGRPRKRKTTDAVVREGLLSQTLSKYSSHFLL